MSFYKSIKSDALSILKKNYSQTTIIVAVIGLVIAMSLVVEKMVYSLADINSGAVIDIFNSLLFGSKMEVSMIDSLQVFLLVSVLISLVFCGLCSVLKMGYVYWNYRAVFKQENNFLHIFNYFSSGRYILKSFWLSVQIFVRKLFWFVILFFPAVAVGAWTLLATINQNQVASRYLISFGYILTLCLTILGFVISLIFFRRYSLTRYLLVSDDNMKVREAIKLSIKIMKTKKMDYLLLILSFWGWFLLVPFVLPLFFVVPYMSFSMTLYSRYLVEGHNKQKEL